MVVRKSMSPEFSLNSMTALQSCLDVYQNFTFHTICKAFCIQHCTSKRHHKELSMYIRIDISKHNTKREGDFQISYT